MVKMKFSTTVEKFGNEKQKEAFKKMKGNLMTANFNSLVKTLEQHYKTVRVEGIGSKRVFYLNGKYDEVQSRDDKRSGNGKELAYEYELNSLIIEYLRNPNRKMNTDMTTRQWLVELQIIDSRLRSALSNEGALKGELHLLKERFPGCFKNKDTVIINHFLNTEIGRLTRNLKSIFKRMNDSKIILYTKTYQGVGLDGFSETLDNEKVAYIGQLRESICEKYDVKLIDIPYKRKDKRVAACMEELETMYKEMGYKYIYESHACYLQVNEAGTNKYLEKIKKKKVEVHCQKLHSDHVASMLEQFKNEYSDSSITSASKRSKNAELSSERLNYVRRIKQYVPMWERLMIYYNLLLRVQPQTEFPNDPLNPFLQESFVFDDDKHDW